MLWIYLSCQEPKIHDSSIIETEPVEEGWHSALYPPDWTPDYTSSEGLFLHDFSYAGYQNGEASIPTITEMEHFSVLEYGADPTTANDSTAAFEEAISAASIGGGVVWVPEGLYKISDTLQIQQPNVVIAGEGPDKSQLWFSKETAMTDNASILFKGSVQQSPDYLLTQDALSRSHNVFVENATELSPDQDVALGWIISPEFVEEHGMAQYWEAFNDRWVPFFRRDITTITEDIVSLDVPTRYNGKLRDQASLRIESGYLFECGIQDIGVSNAIDRDLAQTYDRAHAIQMEEVKDCWIQNVYSFKAPNQEEHLQSGGIKILSSKRVTISDSNMQKAQNRGGGGNGYLFEISQSSEILIKDSVGSHGRHNFIQNWGFGTSGCVFLRTYSHDGVAYFEEDSNLTTVGYSEFHHSLAMSNLIDNSTADDGWKAVNRLFYSSGAGHTATENVFWNVRGSGSLYSYQYQNGYVIGTEELEVYTEVTNTFENHGTAPEDYSEGIGEASTLIPQSLYEDQLEKRLSP